MKKYIVIGWILLILWFIGWGCAVWVDEEKIWNLWGLLSLATGFIWIIVFVKYMRGDDYDDWDDD